MSKTTPAPIGHNNPPVEDGDSLDRDGWVAVSRGMRSHWLVGFGQSVKPQDPDRGSHSRSEAWIDLIMECKYYRGTVNNGGKRMILEAGQLLGAVAWLASRWNWTPKTVRGFLDRLEEEAMIERFTPGTRQYSDDDLNGTQLGKQKGKQAAIINISNYLIYQLSQRDQGRAKSHAEGTQGASKGQAEGNSNKDNNETREQGNQQRASQQTLSESPPSGLAGLNGSADLMVADIIRWMHNGDERSARKWLASCISTYGQTAMKDAWAKLNTDMVNGMTVAQPLPTWTKIAQRMRDNPSPAKPSSASTHEQAMRQINQIAGPRK